MMYTFVWADGNLHVSKKDVIRVLAGIPHARNLVTGTFDEDSFAINHAQGRVPNANELAYLIKREFAQYDDDWHSLDRYVTDFMFFSKMYEKYGDQFWLDEALTAQSLAKTSRVELYKFHQYDIGPPDDLQRYEYNGVAIKGTLEKPKLWYGEPPELDHLFWPINSNGPYLRLSQDELEALQDNDMIFRVPGTGVLPAQEEEDALRGGIPDTIPWGDSEQNYYRTAMEVHPSQFPWETQELPQHDDYVKWMYEKYSNTAHIPPLDELAEHRYDSECYEVANIIANQYPQLQVDSGFYVHPKRGVGDHGWNISPDGTIVDMTAKQHDYLTPEDEETWDEVSPPIHPEIIYPDDPIYQRYVSWERHPEQAQEIAHGLDYHEGANVLPGICPLCLKYSSLRKFADWNDVMEKAKRYLDESRVNIQSNTSDPQMGNHVVGQVQGDTGLWDTEIWKDDPNSGAISRWHCDCEWGQHAWGRCLTEDTAVSLADGSEIPIANIRVGDAVIDHNGDIGIVADIHQEIWDDEIIRINGLGLKPTHPVLMVSQSDVVQTNITKAHNSNLHSQARLRSFSVTSEPKFALSKTIETGDYLVRPHLRAILPMKKLDLSPFVSEFAEIDESSITRYRQVGSRWGTIMKSRRGKVLPRYVQISEDLMRLIGYFIAEGCTSENSTKFSFHKDETECHNDITQIVRSIFGLDVKFEHSNTNCTTLCVNHTELAVIFRSMIGHRVENKRVPEWAMFLPLNLQCALLEGWFNGDGHIRKSDGRYELTTVSSNLAHQAELLLQRQGYVVHIIQERRSLRNTNERDAFKLIWIRDQQSSRGKRFVHKQSTLVQCRAETEHYTGTLYDLTIIGNPGFLANGYAVHNTRQWKKYNGRPCAHTLALYWASYRQPPQQQDMADIQPGQQTQLFDPNQFMTQVPPRVPGGPNIGPSNPEELQVQTQVPGAEGSGQEELQPDQLMTPAPYGGPQGGEPVQLTFPGALSKTAMPINLPSAFRTEVTPASVHESGHVVAFDGDEPIGILSIDSNGVISNVEVLPRYQRRGVATSMVTAYEDYTGEQVHHDWDNMLSDGRQWAQTFKSSTIDQSKFSLDELARLLYGRHTEILHYETEYALVDEVERRVLSGEITKEDWIAAIDRAIGRSPSYSKVASTDFYHLAPTTERARIFAHGLQPSAPYLSENWPGATVLKNQKPGIYALPTPAQSESWRYFYDKPMDIWRIPANQVINWHDDPKVTDAVVIPHAVDAELYRPYEDTDLSRDILMDQEIRQNKRPFPDWRMDWKWNNLGPLPHTIPEYGIGQLAKTAALFNNGDKVKVKRPVQGIDRDNVTHVIPRNTTGEVLYADENDAVVIFPLPMSGRLEAHLVRVECSPNDLMLTRRNSPFIQKRTHNPLDAFAK